MQVCYFREFSFRHYFRLPGMENMISHHDCSAVCPYLEHELSILSYKHLLTDDALLFWGDFVSFFPRLLFFALVPSQRKAIPKPMEGSFRCLKLWIFGVPASRWKSLVSRVRYGYWEGIGLPSPYLRSDTRRNKQDLLSWLPTVRCPTHLCVFTSKIWRLNKEGLRLCLLFTWNI